MVATFNLDDQIEIFGRERERVLLGEALERALAGSGGVVLIGGEAGIGKTTLVADLVRTAAERDALVLAGGCFDLITTPPYGPWIDLLEGYPDAGNLPKIPAALRAGSMASVASQPELFELVREFLVVLAGKQPTVIVLEDLHWADRASLDLLRYLARQTAELALLLVASYRDDELSREHPFFRLLPLITREAGATHILVQRFDEPAVRAMVRDAYALPPVEESRLSEHIHRLSGGNPLFAAELLRTLEDQGMVQSTGKEWQLGEFDAIAIPPLVVQVIEARLARLDEPTRRLLEVAAVIGQEVPIDLWIEIADADGDVLAEAVTNAVEGNVLRQASRGPTLQFTHALVRETLHKGTMLLRRRDWHRRLAETLAERNRPSADAVAYHFEQAGDLRAVAWHLHAGHQAQAVYAPDAAAAHFSAALELAAFHDLALPVEALRGRAVAYSTVGQFANARADFERALQIADEQANARLRWEVLTDLGQLWSARDYSRTGAYLRAALALAREEDDARMLATSLNALGNWHLNIEQHQAARDYYAEALQIFSTLGDQQGILATYDLLSMVSAMRGDLAEGERYARLGIDLSHRLGTRQREAHTLSLLSICATLAFEDPLVPAEVAPEEGRAAGARALGIAREIEWRAGEAYFSSIFADYLTYRGELGPALEHAATGLRLAERIEHRQWMAAAHNALARVHHQLLDFASMQRHAEHELELGREVGSGIWTYRGSADLALALIGQGQLQEAEALLDATLPAGTAAESCQQLLCHYARVRLFLGREDPEPALAFIDRLRLTIPRVQDGGADVPRLALARGQALTALGRLEEAEAELAPARSMAAARGARALGWQLAAELAAVYTGLGRIEDAAQQQSVALAVIDEMAATLADAAMRDGFLERAHEQRAIRPPAPATGSPAPIAGLSPREMEVLQLVARGLTDAQVAELLYISPRTVGGHLQSIYNKLGLSSRVEATRFAFRHGIG